MVNKKKKIRTRIAANINQWSECTYSSTQFNDTNISRTFLSIDWYHCSTFYPLLDFICNVRNNLQQTRDLKLGNHKVATHRRFVDKRVESLKTDLHSLAKIISLSLLVNNRLWKTEGTWWLKREFLNWNGRKKKGTRRDLINLSRCYIILTR